MTTPKQDMKQLKMIVACYEQIHLRGARARVTITMPSTTNKCKTRRMAANGPHGTIIAHTVSGKKALVVFRAVELLTSLVEVRDG